MQLDITDKELQEILNFFKLTKKVEAKRYKRKENESVDADDLFFD